MTSLHGGRLASPTEQYSAENTRTVDLRGLGGVMQQFTVKIRAGRVGHKHSRRPLERTSIAKFAAALRRVEDTMGIYDSYITREAWYL